MNKMHLTEEETLLIQWIRKTRLSPAELMLTTQMLRRAARGTRGRQQCVELGIQAWREMKRTVSFKTCVEESLKARAHRRPRTLGEIRSVSARMMREWPALQGKMMRSLRTEDCRAILSRFPTPGGMRKARVILHGICAFACRRGWAGGNPVEGTFAPAVIEKKIPVLMPEECGRLIRTAQKEYDGACLPAAVLMLYAGVRPQEVRRLRFRHLRLENGELIIPSTHSKTGGSRLVTLQPVALRFLRSFRRVPPDTFICPKGWERKWREGGLEQKPPLGAGHIAPYLRQLSRCGLSGLYRSSMGNGPPGRKTAANAVYEHGFHRTKTRGSLLERQGTPV